MTLVLMAGLSAMALNVFLPALPDMATHFGTDYKVMQLSVGIFLAVNAVLQIIIGPLSDRYGRRPVIMVGTGTFMIATVFAIYAPSIESFLLMRAAQAGIVTGMVLSRAIVRDIAPAESAGSMIAYVTMGMAVVPMLAPTVGGYLSQAFGWQANFWLLLIAGGALMVLFYFDLGDTAPDSGGRTLSETFRAFPEILTSKRFLGYAFSTAFASGAFFAYLGGAPFVGSTRFGLSEDKLGLYMGAPALGYFFGNFLAGRYSRKLGTNNMVLIGAVIATAGLLASLALYASGHATAETFFGFMVLLGLGNGMQLPNAIAGSLSVVRPELVGSASGLGGTLMIGGGAILSALAGSVLSEDTGATPLLLIMCAAAFASILAILWVIQREKRLALS